MGEMTNLFKIHVRIAKRKNTGVNGKIILRRLHSNSECEYVDYSQLLDCRAKC